MNLLKLPVLFGIGAALLAGVPALAEPAVAPAAAAPTAAPANDPAPRPRVVPPAAAPTPAPTAAAPAAPAVAEPPPFVAPADGVVAFRRDRLPLDADTMSSLSRQFGMLAQAQGGETPVNRRTAAQLLALALALQPGNPEARGILEKFAAGGCKPAGDAKQLETARAGVWSILAWLETPAAGRDAQALAACLGDVLVIADPQHPRAAELSKKGEQGAWTGWVQPLESFEKIVKVVKNDAPVPPALPVPKTDTAPKGPIYLTSAVVTTPLWNSDKAATPADKAATHAVLRPVPVQMHAKLKEGAAKSEPLSCALEYSQPSTTPDSNSFKTTSAALVKALEKLHGKVPAGVAVSLVCGDNADYLIDRNHSAISGAAAVLMNAAITGCEPNATIIGEIQADGSFKLPPRFWDKLRALTDGPGGRLVLPQEAEACLPSILALEEAGFFFKYEVLLASNIEELIERSAKNPAPELEPVIANFLEIRSKRGSQPVTEYAANRFVRVRLENLAREASFHASARMLAIQGAGKRPALLPRNLLASELRRAIRPIAWIPSHPVDTLQTKSLNAAYEACLRDVDRLERHAEMRDRPLHIQTHEMVLSLRALTRATRGRSVDSSTGSAPWRGEFYAFSRAYQTVTKALSQAAADGG